MQTFFKLLFLMFGLNATILYSSEYPEIKETRPRIYASQNRLYFIKSMRENIPELKSSYDNFTQAYYGWWINDPELFLEGEDTTKWTWNWNSQWAGAEAFYTVFLYKVTDSAIALKRSEFIAKQAVNCIDTTDFAKIDWYSKETLLRQMSDAIGILLDWNYDVLPANLRKQLTQTYFRMNQEFMNTYIFSSAGTSYVSSHNTWNNIYCNQNVLVLYNAVDLTKDQKDTVMNWYYTLYDKLINGFIPCWTYYRDDDGGWNWGAAYAMWSLVDQFQLFENMLIATGKNFYEDLPWVRESINQYIYFMQPNNRIIHLGDGETVAGADRVIYLHSKYFNDKRSNYLDDYWSQITPNTNHNFAKLLYKDFMRVPQNQHHNSSLNWFADKVGLAVSYSSWEKDATMLSFFNSPSKKAAHEHRDNNSFAIFKHSPLLIDAGYYDTYGGTHYRNYYQRTIAHNCIVVFDSSEKFNYGLDSSISNDGGQIESPTLMNYDNIFQEQFQRGKWIQYFAGDSICYYVADAQLSYDSNKLDLFRRKVLYIKPNRFLILDNLHLRNLENHHRQTKWIGHFITKPEIKEKLINTQISGHIETYEGGNYTVANQLGNIAIRTLLPRNSEVKLIGGDGYEYWVNGVNYPPLTIPDSNYSSGAWRIEVSPSINDKDSLVFLHSIEVGDTNSISQNWGKIIEDSLSIAIESMDIIYSFSKNGGINSEYRSISGIEGVGRKQFYLFDMLSGDYIVYLDGMGIDTITVQNNTYTKFYLDFQSNSHTIELKPISSGIYSRTIPILTDKMELLKYLADKENIMVEFFNYSGQIIASITDNPSELLHTLAVGIYFIKISNKNNSEFFKLIIPE